MYSCFIEEVIYDRYIAVRVHGDAFVDDIAEEIREDEDEKYMKLKYSSGRRYTK